MSGITADSIYVDVKYHVPQEVVLQVIASFVAQTDPVTRGWVVKVEQEPGARKNGFRGDDWYSKWDYWTKFFRAHVTVLEDERTGETKLYTLDVHGIVRGLSQAANFDAKGSYRWAFTNVVEGNVDGPTADIIVQLALFGREVYA